MNSFPCYLLAQIDTVAGRVLSYLICHDPNPSMIVRGPNLPTWAILMQTNGETPGESYDEIIAMLRWSLTSNLHPFKPVAEALRLTLNSAKEPGDTVEVTD